MSRLKFASEHVIWTEAMTESLTCSVVTGEGSFDTILRHDICLSVLKAALNLEEDE